MYAPPRRQESRPTRNGPPGNTRLCLTAFQRQPEEGAGALVRRAATHDTWCSVRFADGKDRGARTEWEHTVPSIGESDSIVRVSLRDATRFIRKAGIPAAAVAIVAASIAYWVGLQGAPEHRSVAILLATRTAAVYPTSSVLVPPLVDPGVYRSVLVEGPLLAIALEQMLGVPADDAMLREARSRLRVRVEDSLVSSLIRIEVQDSDPHRAAEFANLLSDALRDWDRNRLQRNLAAGIDALNQAIDRVDAAIETAAAAGDDTRAALLNAYRAERVEALEETEALYLSGANVGLLESFRRADVSSAPVDDRATVNAVLAFLIGLAATFIVLLARQVYSPFILSAQDVARVIGGRIIDGGIVNGASQGARVETLTGWLHVRLKSVGDVGESGRVHLFTCARSSSDKAGLALRVAESLADGGYRVLLVEADQAENSMTAPQGIRFQGVTRSERALTGSQQLRGVVTIATTAGNSLDVATTVRRVTGNARPIDAGVSESLEDWRRSYNVVVVDGAPALPAADVHAIAPIVDSIVFGVTLGRTTVVDARDAVAALRDVTSAPLVTVVAGDT